MILFSIFLFVIYFIVFHPVLEQFVDSALWPTVPCMRYTLLDIYLPPN